MLIPSAEIDALFRKAVQYGLHERRSMLTSGIDEAYVAGLEQTKFPNDQMLLDLRAMNVTDRVVGSDIPLRQWLTNANLVMGAQTTDFADLAARIVAKADPSVIESQQQAQSTLATLQALAGSNDAFRHALAAASEQFDAIAARVKLLMAYKGLHDFLHDIQVFRLPMIQATLPAGTPSGGWAAMLGRFVDELEFKLEQVRADKVSMLVTGSRARQDEERWLEEFSEICRGFRSATKTETIDLGRDALFNLRRLIRHNMSRLNVRLYDAAGQLDIAGLVERLRSFAISLADDDSRAEHIREAATKLLVLQSEIDALLGEHDSWQQIDDRLWTAEEALLFGGDLALVNFAQLWPVVIERVTLIAGTGTAEWYVRAQQFANSFKDRCPLPVVPPITVVALDDFREFVNSARNQFFHVDSELKRRCSRLTQIAEPLEELARTR